MSYVFIWRIYFEQETKKEEPPSVRKSASGKEVLSSRFVKDAECGRRYTDPE